MYSCLVLTVECETWSIDTIEGLADGDRLDPVQAAFIEADALQCGYCTPGQIMSVRALLDEMPCPTDAQTTHALAGNLCRCGAYRHILEAVELAAAAEADQRSVSVVGVERRRSRVEAIAKVTGRAQYTSDVHVVGQLEAALLRSSPSARERARCRRDEARSLPGVHAVLTGDDLDGMVWYEERSPILADVARFVGDELAVVAADSKSSLDAALRGVASRSRAARTRDRLHGGRAARRSDRARTVRLERDRRRRALRARRRRHGDGRRRSSWSRRRTRRRFSCITRSNPMVRWPRGTARR